MPTPFEAYITSADFSDTLRRLIRKTRQLPFSKAGSLRRPAIESYISDDDLIQQIKIHLIERQNQFTPDHGSIAAWAYTVAKNKLIDILRAEARRMDKASGRSASMPDEMDGCAHSDEPVDWRERPISYRSGIGNDRFSDIGDLGIGTEDLDLLQSRIRSALGRVSAVAVRAWHHFIPLPTWRSWLIEGDFPTEFPDADFPILTRAEQLGQLESLTGKPRNTLIQALNRAMRVLEQTSFARKLRELE